MVQILALVFFTFTLSRAFLRWRDGSLTLGELVFWGLVWVGMGVIVLAPQITTRVAGWLGVGRGSDLVLYGAVALVFYLVFRIYVMLERLEQQITTLVRHEALRELEERRGA
jgi:hypothetical protein